MTQHEIWQRSSGLVLALIGILFLTSITLTALAVSGFIGILLLRWLTGLSFKDEDAISHASGGGLALLVIAALTSWQIALAGAVIFSIVYLGLNWLHRR